MNTTTAPSLLQIPRGELQPNPWNRKHFNPEKLRELADSILAQGVIQPLVVRALEPVTGVAMEFPGYEIIAGERRWRASELAGLDALPCVVRELSDQQARELCAIENLQREDLTALEEAQGYSDLLRECQCKVEDLEERLGRKRSHIYARLRLLTLPPAVKAALGEGRIEASVADLLATIPEAKQQEAALKVVTEETEWDEEADGYVPKVTSFRRAKLLVEEKFRKSLKNAPWGLTQELAGVQSCVVCPRLTANIPGLPHGSAPNVCTEPACYARKLEAHTSSLLAQHKAEGKTVLEGKAAPKFQYGGLAYNSGYLPADAKRWVKDKHVPVTTLLGKKMPAPAYAVNPEGEVVAVYDEKQVNAALAAAGLVEPRPAVRQAESEEDLAKAKLAHKVNQLVSDRMATEVIGMVEFGTPAVLAQALQFFIEQMDHSDGFNHEVMARRRGWNDVTDVGGGHLVDRAKKLDWRGKLALLFESVLCDSYGDTYFEETTLALAKRLGLKLDEKRIEKEVRAELAAAAKAAEKTTVAPPAPAAKPAKAAKPTKATKAAKASTKAKK